MIGKYESVEITDEDLKLIINFILLKFKTDPLHMQGTSLKSDLIGGFIERWFNKVAETVVFNYLLKEFGIEVVPDYFLYTNETEKNAPDIIGLKLHSGNVIPLVRFNNNTWESIPNMPRVEVKVVRKEQSLVAVREPQMINDYYAFIESDLEEDYLATVFEDSVFDDKYFEKLQMGIECIKSDTGGKIIRPFKIKRPIKIGTMRLIGIYKKDDLLNKTLLCKAKEAPYYFSEVANISPRALCGSTILTVGRQGLTEYSYNSKKYLPFLIEGIDPGDLEVCGRSGSTVYFSLPRLAQINGVTVQKGHTKVTFKKFERSSAWAENIALKYVIEKCTQDSTSELLDKFRIIVGNNKN